MAVYGGSIPPAAVRLRPRLEIDAARQAFVEGGAERANAFLWPREFRRPDVLEAVPAVTSKAG